MEDLVKEINSLYQEALKAGLCHNQTQFAQLVRKDRGSICYALNGSRINGKLVDEVREILKDKGVIGDVINIDASGDHIEGNGNATRGGIINGCDNEELIRLRVEVQFLREQVKSLQNDKEILTKLLQK